MIWVIVTQEQTAKKRFFGRIRSGNRSWKYRAASITAVKRLGIRIKLLRVAEYPLCPAVVSPRTLDGSSSLSGNMYRKAAYIWMILLTRFSRAMRKLVTLWTVKGAPRCRYRTGGLRITETNPQTTTNRNTPKSGKVVPPSLYPILILKLERNWVNLEVNYIWEFRTNYIVEFLNYHTAVCTGHRPETPQRKPSTTEVLHSITRINGWAVWFTSPRSGNEMAMK